MIRFIQYLIRAAACLIPLLPGPISAQAAEAGTGGMVALAHNRLFGETSRRVLVIGAHPDDEDSQLLAVLVRGMGVETAYLSLTRGEGGQNLIGSELGPALGVLRTEELLAARRIDGALQYFTRAYDFGFSKSATSAFGFWAEDTLVHDVVAVIRRFRPQVVISIWQGTTADGHGQHQAAGIVARKAWDAAGNAVAYPDAGEPWQPAKFYRSVRGGTAGDGRISFDTGALDPAVGQSFRQLAARSRSQHQSQAQGEYQTPGPATTAIRLEARIPQLTGPDDSLFAGIVPEARKSADGYRSEVILAEAGVVLDAWVERAAVVPGAGTRGTLTVWNTGKDTVTGKADLVARAGWQIDPGSCSSTYLVAPGGIFNCRFTAVVSLEAAPTTPYYLRDSLVGAFYQWDRGGEAIRFDPFQPAELRANFQLSVANQELMMSREAQARSLSQAVGEIRRPVEVVPKLGLRLEPELLVWPSGSGKRHSFKLEVHNFSHDTTRARISLMLPSGWISDSARSVTLIGEGASTTLDFQVTLPGSVKTGAYGIRALAMIGADSLKSSVIRVDYPNITPHNIVTEARSRVVMVDLNLPARTPAIGYLRGAADRIPEALINAGIPLRIVQSSELPGPVLDSLGTLVIGPRAYELDEGLRAAHPRIIQWVERGGTLLLQYQQYQFAQGGFPPLPLTFDRPAERVTEPDAAVTFIHPDHPLLNTPNRITSEDFLGWIQERGLYFPSSWDSGWSPLLSMHDAGEPARLGSLLYTSLGKGKVIYTGLSFFRELPAGVPGAWRLFINLLAWGSR